MAQLMQNQSFFDPQMKAAVAINFSRLYGLHHYIACEISALFCKGEPCLESRNVIRSKSMK